MWVYRDDINCNYPNSLTDKEKAIIADGLSNVAPLTHQSGSTFKID